MATKKRVLVVSAAPPICEVMHEYLTTRTPSYEVRTAADGPEAQRIAEVWAPDLVITNHILPNTPRFGVLTWLKGRPDLAHAKVIIATGYYPEGERERALEHGALELIPLPIDLSGLGHFIDQELGPALPETDAL